MPEEQVGAALPGYNLADNCAVSNRNTNCELAQQFTRTTGTTTWASAWFATLTSVG